MEKKQGKESIEHSLILIFPAVRIHQRNPLENADEQEKHHRVH